MVTAMNSNDNKYLLLNCFNISLKVWITEFGDRAANCAAHVVVHILTSWSVISVDFHFTEWEDPFWTRKSQSYITPLHTTSKIHSVGFACTNFRNLSNPNRKCVRKYNLPWQQISEHMIVSVIVLVEFADKIYKNCNLIFSISIYNGMI